ncbi:peptidase M1 [Maribacter sp. MMG018]|uniref:M1 family aminopeptidase n=1 Tax=Maribacter sp. MMG018 TaxID=2822688 RepID=UPI001B392973|nr:M1 family aminopeptidase [Maribacter sp. MMG018]MBQ4914392.1 peptidase M1 [Maribacter sp. MMG018]
MRPYYFFYLAIFLLCSCNNKTSDSLKIADGVPLELAELRKVQVSDVIYNLSFNIPDSKNDPIPSKLKLELTINDLNAPLYLDFKEDSDHLKKITIDNKEIDMVHKNEHIEISPTYLQKGTNVIEIDFLAGELSLNRNDDFLYTLLVPDRARTLFPCFDQPNIKATYILNITAPKDWQVLCAAPETDQQETNGFITHQFAPSDKMSTYLFSFVAGVFNTAEKNIDNFPMTMLYRETDSSKVAYSTNDIFELHQQSKSFLEEYTAHAFPFQKLDFATIPGFQYGGMEHVGAIQYKESSLFLDESATTNRKLGRAKLIAHETSHMWFGDLVTMDWFNDVWMKEVFANFMADKIVNPAFPEINHELAFMASHYPRAYGEDRTKGTNPIRQDLENLNNAGSLYGSIIYNKAPIMMRQLEMVLGKESFKTGIQEYIDTYKNGNAVWNDLIQILDKNTTEDLLKWSQVWVNSAGRPIFTDSITYTPKGEIASFEIKQMAEDGTDHIWPQTFDLTFIYKNKKEVFKVDMKNGTLELSEAIGKQKPTAIIYNSNGMGYGVFPLRSTTLKNIHYLEDEVTRGSLYINAYENTLNGTINPVTILDFYSEALYREKNELLSNLVSGYLRSIFWKYLTPEDRLQQQEAVTKKLWTELQRKDISPNIKKTLFSTFKSLAYKGDSRALLYKVWNKDVEIADLRLNQDDFTQMAMDLALYGHPEQQEILAIAKKTITNPDKLKRFDYLLPSLSAEEQIKDDFIASLKEEKNRAKEAWTVTAMNNINHPLHQKKSIKYLRASLDLLDEIQKTGDIFFPKRWLSSTIGNYTSADAYEILENYLSENPDLNPSLKNKVWQAADDLRRVQTLHKNIDRSSN